MKRSEQDMATWLAHPMEFGEPPEAIEEVHRETTPWPLFDKPVALAFHRYRMKDGFSGIGLTGPITWSFIGDDLRGFTPDELKRLYAGWYIAFAAVNDANYSRERNKQERQALEARLREKLAGFIGVVDYLSFGELVFYAYKIKQGDEEVVIATDRTDTMAYEAGSKYLRLPPLYYFLGSLFFEGKL
jgi:hypothetical protein